MSIITVPQLTTYNVCSRVPMKTLAGAAYLIQSAHEQGLTFPEFVPRVMRFLRERYPNLQGDQLATYIATFSIDFPKHSHATIALVQRLIFDSIQESE